MLPYIVVLLIAVILVAGIGIVSFFAYKTVKVQQEMILNIAMFKKASEPFHLNMMKASMAQTLDQETEKVQEDPNDGPSIPNNPDDEAMRKLRSSI